jgi:plastocyanin
MVAEAVLPRTLDTLVTMVTKHLLFVGAFALLAACGGRDGGASDHECADPQPADTVQLADFEFRPDCFMAVAGATIGLENTGEAPHTFTVEGTDVDVDLDAGDSDDVTIPDVEPDEYRVTCTYHPQMIGTLTIR